MEFFKQIAWVGERKLDAAAKKVGRQCFQNHVCDPSVGLWVAGSHWWAAVPIQFRFFAQ